MQLGRHLAWSCFFWDKTLSLYLGRTPSLPEPPKWDPALPEEPEPELWPPYPIPDDEALQSYQPRPSHLLLCFAYTCKISLIVSDILFSIYGSKRTKCLGLCTDYEGEAAFLAFKFTIGFACELPSQNMPAYTFRSPTNVIPYHHDPTPPAVSQQPSVLESMSRGFSSRRTTSSAPR